jgi:hypothetical protein
MVNRKELEGLVALGIQEIRAAERGLQARYGSLKKANLAKRLSFLESLDELARRASQLERLVDQLDDRSQELSAA